MFLVDIDLQLSLSLVVLLPALLVSLLLRLPRRLKPYLLILLAFRYNLSAIVDLEAFLFAVRLS
jgi:hypothetical protein